MKWYENIVNGGDGSYSTSRYRTLEEAKQAAEIEFEDYGIPVDGPNLVDTDCPTFFDEVHTDE